MAARAAVAGGGACPCRRRGSRDEHIGGFDRDGLLQHERSLADPVGIADAFASGLVTSGLGGLAATPTIDLRGYTDLFGSDAFAHIHTSFWSVAMQPNDPARAPAALDAMDALLDAIAGYTAPGTAAERTGRNRPDAAAPDCWRRPAARR